MMSISFYYWLSALLMGLGTGLLIGKEDVNVVFVSAGIVLTGFLFDIYADHMEKKK